MDEGSVGEDSRQGNTTDKQTAAPARTAVPVDIATLHAAPAARHLAVPITLLLPQAARRVAVPVDASPVQAARSTVVPFGDIEREASRCVTPVFLWRHCRSMKIAIWPRLLPAVTSAHWVQAVHDFAA